MQTWEEWKYRHEFFWSMVARWVAAIIAVAAVPYISADVGTIFGYYVLAFPLLALVLGVIAVYHLALEHARLLYLRWKMGYRADEEEFLRDKKAVGLQYALRRPISWRLAPYLFICLTWAFVTLPATNLALYAQLYIDGVPGRNIGQGIIFPVLPTIVRISGGVAVTTMAAGVVALFAQVVLAAMPRLKVLVRRASGSDVQSVDAESGV